MHDQHDLHDLYVIPDLHDLYFYEGFYDCTWKLAIVWPTNLPTEWLSDWRAGF